MTFVVALFIAAVSDIAPLQEQIETLTRIGGWVGTLTAIIIILLVTANIVQWRTGSLHRRECNERVAHLQSEIVILLKERIGEQKGIVEAINNQAELYETLQRAVEIITARRGRS